MDDDDDDDHDCSHVNYIGQNNEYLYSKEFIEKYLGKQINDECFQILRNLFKSFLNNDSLDKAKIHTIIERIDEELKVELRTKYGNYIDNLIPVLKLSIGHEVTYEELYFLVNGIVAMNFLENIKLDEYTPPKILEEIRRIVNIYSPHLLSHYQNVYDKWIEDTMGDMKNAAK